MRIIVGDTIFFNFYKKILFFILKINLIFFVIIWILVWYFIPDASALKQDLAYRELYSAIPYFGFVYRYASVTKFIGLLAIPFAIYYLQVGNIKEFRSSLILSFSVFIIGLATYNRAVMVLFLLLLICSYLLFQDKMISDLKVKTQKWLKWLSLGCIVFFIGISVVRFTSSSMEYYKDDISDNSTIKNPVLFSFLSYFSQGTINGINFLELYNGENKIWGAMITYDFNQLLSYFNLVHWNETQVETTLDKTYNIKGLSFQNKSDNFHGFAGDLVANFGYFLSLIISLAFFLAVRSAVINRNQISFSLATLLILLLIIPINSIFYMSFGMLVFPIIFYYSCKILYSAIVRK